LEDGCPIAKNEVYGAIDVTFTVELAERVGIEGVLVPFHAAPVEGRLVGVDTERNSLMVLGSGRVSKRHVPCYKSLPGDRYKQTKKKKSLPKEVICMLGKTKWGETSLAPEVSKFLQL